ncbi:MAG TPA: NADH-quinone oxidoreductase subunit NuoB [Casimicrobiaceae bacterium]|nr:NADH-quinone oxidoreductase subunit NuoB [Casimicrobiaceae bacterium]
MYALLRRIVRTGIRSEPAPARTEDDRIADHLDEAIRHRLGRALAIRYVDAGSCNACELEVQALANPYYNLEGYGIRFVASPRHADALMVSGPVSKHMAIALKRTYDATPDPKFVIAVGDCARGCGILAANYATCAKVADVIPVDIEVPGCPPSPSALLRAILAAVR